MANKETRNPKKTVSHSDGKNIQEHASTNAAQAGKAKRGVQKSAARKGKPLVPDDLRHRMTLETAYYMAERRGFSPGHEVEDWIAAERLVSELLSNNQGGMEQR